MVANQTITIGTNVCFTIGTTSRCGTVVDDRGPIGFNNTRIFKIKIPNDPYDDMYVELPEDELEFSQADLDSALPETAVINYLKNGGLLSILALNISDGKNHPKVWLRQDSLGNAIYTLIEERGEIGGSTVPYRALHDNKIFLPKLKDVLEFVRSFDLSLPKAKDVTTTIGTAP